MPSANFFDRAAGFEELRFGLFDEEAVDKTCEFREVVEALIEQTVDDLQVYVQIAVDDHVAEAGHGAKPHRKLGRKDPEVGELIDGRRVVRNVSSGARGKMCCDVEHILGA